MSKKTVATAVALVGGAAVMFASLAGAQTSTSSVGASATSSVSIQKETREQKPEVQIGPNGKALLRGTLVSTGSSSLVVKSWGGNWTVNLSDSTKVMPKSESTSSLAYFTAGDWIEVNGTASQDQPWTINAKNVRDQSIKRISRENEKEVKKFEKEIRKEGKERESRNFEGTASNVSTASFTLTVGQTAYTVNVSASTKVVNKGFLNLGLVQIKSGDALRVFGSASGTVITAEVVRDTSISL